MSAEPDLELVRELHPESPEHPRAREHARRALLAEVAGEARSPAPRRRRRRRALLPSIAVAGAAAAIIAGVLIAAGPQGGAVRPQSAAAAVLERAAAAAQASGGPPELGPGDYWYVHSRSVVNGAVFGPRGGLVVVDAITIYDRQIWQGVDKPGLVRQRPIAVRFLSPAARRRWVSAGRPAFARTPLDARLRADSFDPAYRQLIMLPTNVDALYAVVERRAGKGSPSWRQGRAWQSHEMFTVVGDLLREQPIPAGVRAALYRVAARIPGIEVAGLTDDAIGRPALAITLNDSFDGSREELLFDPHTATLLGETSVVENPPPKYHVKPGTIESGITFLTSRITQRIGQ